MKLKRSVFERINIIICTVWVQKTVTMAELVGTTVINNYFQWPWLLFSGWTEYSISLFCPINGPKPEDVYCFIKQRKTEKLEQAKCLKLVKIVAD